MPLQLDMKQIQKILPHRKPMLLLDKVLHLEEGKVCKAIKKFSQDEFYFQGHFPQKAVLPGIFMIEAMAQAGAVAVLSMPKFIGKIAMLASADAIKVRNPVYPGDELVITAVIRRLSAIGGKGHGIATVGEKVACEGELSFIIS